jgi:hypothetical protein
MRYPGDDVHLTRHERVSTVAYLEHLDGQLGQLAGWLDDRDDPRAAAMIMSAQRSILACAHLVAPASGDQLQDVIEQRASFNGSHSAG